MQIVTVLAQKKIFLIQQSQIAFDIKLHAKPVFSWSKRIRRALLELEAKSVVDLLSV